MSHILHVANIIKALFSGSFDRQNHKIRDLGKYPSINTLLPYQLQDSLQRKAFLPQVSWIRVGDLHILSVGKYKYSTDSRLSVIFNEPEQEWVLQIAGVTESDAGMYECQISTKPVLSFMVSMEVVGEAPREVLSSSLCLFKFMEFLVCV